MLQWPYTPATHWQSCMVSFGNTRAHTAILDRLAANLTNFCTSSELLRHPVCPKIGSRYSIRDWGSDGSWQCNNVQKATISLVSWSLLQTKNWHLNKNFLKWWIFYHQFGSRWLLIVHYSKGALASWQDQLRQTTVCADISQTYFSREMFALKPEFLTQ